MRERINAPRLVAAVPHHAVRCRPSYGRPNSICDSALLRVKPFHPVERRTILVAEDEPELRSLISNALSPLGYSVLLAKNGEHAYRLCRQYRGSYHPGFRS
jgi:hypothetical protein